MTSRSRRAPPRPLRRRAHRDLKPENDADPIVTMRCPAPGTEDPRDIERVVDLLHVLLQKHAAHL